MRAELFGFATTSFLVFQFILTGALARESTDPHNYCRTYPIRTEALDDPNKHAWDLFEILMHPALPKEVARGEPDCSKPIGAPGATSVWETWRLARTEVFLENGSFPPSWDDLSLPSGFLGATPGADEQSEGMGHAIVADIARSIEQSPGGATVLFDPEPNQSVFAGRGGIGETRMNRATYDFIRANCLYSLDGLKRYAQAVADGKKPVLSFPSNSIEVKAVWLEFTPEAVDGGATERYYSITHEGKVYGLTSFHVLTKDVPEWFWATFHHIDAPENEFERGDTYGRPGNLDGTVWENYVLGGTQAAFVEPDLTPNILSDHYVEFGFRRSSCISCHSMAHLSPEGVNGQDFDDPEGPIQTIAIGIPLALQTDGSTKSPFESKAHAYTPADFLWSIPFRARAEKEAPPSFCKF